MNTETKDLIFIVGGVSAVITGGAIVNDAEQKIEAGRSLLKTISDGENQIYSDIRKEGLELVSPLEQIGAAKDRSVFNLYLQPQNGDVCQNPELLSQLPAVNKSCQTLANQQKFHDRFNQLYEERGLRALQESKPNQTPFYAEDFAGYWLVASSVILFIFVSKIKSNLVKLMNSV